jgi:hypothetical protein
MFITDVNEKFIGGVADTGEQFIGGVEFQEVKYFFLLGWGEQQRSCDGLGGAQRPVLRVIVLV